MRSDASPQGSATTLRVWDLPTRLFHWALAFAVLGSYLSAKAGGLWMIWHFRFGYTILALLLFRLLWGFVGGHYARFSSFLYGPGSVLHHLRGDARAPLSPGHSPLGSLSVFALIGLLGLQVGSGLFANDDIAFEGPLAHWISKSTSDVLTALHHRSQWVLLALIGLHVAAVLFYLARHRNDLITPMLTGDKRGLAQPFPPSRDDARLRLRALVLAAACGAGVWALLTYATPGFN